MHRSRLSTLCIDTNVPDLDAATRFWSQALGRKSEPVEADSPTYRALTMRDDEPYVILQEVTHSPRVHLDIEADDLEAEVKRLEALGAKRLEFVKRWWVMEAPSGHRFCVVNPQRGPLAALGDRANTWK